MELREFSERVLTGPSLEDKLYDPGPLLDEQPGLPWRGRVSPGRGPGLTLADSAAAFPSDTTLGDAGARGRALHFFANHELLALELMALALLRFPAAPAAFRRSLVATLRDEQRHLSLYLDRMRALGTELGDVALGGFFWRTVADLPTPSAFVAHMSLTFEQANLDHARHYGALFAAVGDSQTAGIMAKVYADEIRHVRVGAHWFGQWHPEASLLHAHRDALVTPVSLRRARGPNFDREGRQAAGLPEDYVEAIANIPHARGKPPVVYLFDPTVELQLAHGASYNPDTHAVARTRDLEALPVLYARPDDAVLVRARPSDAFLATLREAGVQLPELVVTDLDAPRIEAPGIGRIASVQPWGWTPSLARRLSALRARAAEDPVPADGWPADVFAKARGVAVLRRLLQTGDPRLDDPRTLGQVARTLDDALAAMAHFFAEGAATVVLKAALGAAGRGLVRVPAGPLSDPQRAWLTRTLATQGEVVVEPWRDRLCDLSLRLTITTPGTAVIDGVGRCVADVRGQYLGAVVGNLTAGLSQAVTRFLHGDGKDPQWLGRTWRAVADAVADELRPTGYVGKVGVDAIVVRDAAGTLRLRPTLELNTRYHMGHVALHLGKRLAPATVGLWRLRRRVDVVREGFGGLVQYAAHLAAMAPLQCVGDGARRRLCAGVLVTNDPSQARETLGVLAVAPSLAAASAMLGLSEG